MSKYDELQSVAWRQYVRQLEKIAHLGLSSSIKNADVSLQVLAVDNMLLPATINDSKQPDTCWINSLLNTYGLYVGRRRNWCSYRTA